MTPLTDDYLKAEIQQARLALNRLHDECGKLSAMLTRIEAEVGIVPTRPLDWRDWDALDEEEEEPPICHWCGGGITDLAISDGWYCEDCHRKYEEEE